MSTSQAASGSIKPDLKCRVCGHPVPRGTGRTPRELHASCKEFLNFLHAAHRRLQNITFTDQERARVMRGELFAMANEIPHDIYNVRGPDGRFVRA